MPQFHETVFGNRFFSGQLPELIHQLKRIADAMEKTSSKQEEMTLAVKKCLLEDVYNALRDNGIEDNEENYRILTEDSVFKEALRQQENAAWYFDDVIERLKKQGKLKEE